MNASTSSPSSLSPRTLWSKLGPGVLWAGTAVGVSHLVQSTRAGAGYGLGLLWVVVLANLLKYPAFEAGPRFTSATGRDLAWAYARQGRWALGTFGLMTLLTMAIVEAAIVMVTAGMASVLITDAPGVVGWSAILLAVTVVLLLVGRLAVLDRVMRTMMIILSVTTVASVAMVLPGLLGKGISLAPVLPTAAGDVAFIVAFAGWMPAPFDTSVWQSLWAKAEGPADARTARFDFHVAYLGTVVLALCFVTLGAAVLFGAVDEMPGSSVAFAGLLVDTYGSVLGPWARPVILVAAFATMLSTTFSVADGYPRALAATFRHWRGAPEEAGEPVRVGGVLVLAAVSLALIAGARSSFTALVDFATTVSFVLAPVLAVMNYRAVMSDDMPAHARPTGWFRGAHLTGIVILSLFSLGYVAWKWGV